MQSLLTLATLLAIIAWWDGSLVLEVPGLNEPVIHRGTK